MRSLAVVCTLVVLGGCASSIRVVSASKTGGEISLTGEQEDAMAKARVEMARTCGGPTKYEIVSEADVPTGEVPAKTEMRVKYSCTAAAAH